MKYKDKLVWKTIWRQSIFRASILVENHYKGICDCSYCEKAKSKNKKFDIWLPECKSRNSWRVLVFDRGEHWTYIRYTLPSFRCLIDFYRWEYCGRGWRLIVLNLFGNSSFLTIEKMDDNSKKKIKSFCWFNIEQKSNSNTNTEGEVQCFQI